MLECWNCLSGMLELPERAWACWNHLCLSMLEALLELFCLQTIICAPPLDTPDTERAYQEFCESLLSEAKQCIPHGRRKNYVPCWEKKYETLYRSFIRAPVGTTSDRATSSLLCWLKQKKQERWEEAVNSIDFSHSSRKAWRTINKLTGRSGRSSHVCPVSANSIASQLVKNGAHKTSDCEPTRLVNKQLSDLWKIPTPGGMSKTFQAGRVCYCPQRLEARKISAIGLHLPGVHTSRRVGSQILVLRLPQFLHAPTQNFKYLEKSTSSCDP